MPVGRLCGGDEPDMFDESLLCILSSTAILLYLVGNVRFWWNSCIVCYSTCFIGEAMLVELFSRGSNPVLIPYTVIFDGEKG